MSERKNWDAQLQKYPIKIEDGVIESGVVAWIRPQGSDGNYLLAHADDGVIWGWWKDGSLITSYEAADDRQQQTYCPELRDETLQQARIFNEQGEIYLWRNSQDGNWRYRKLMDTGGDQMKQAYDEKQILWGTHARPAKYGFSTMSDGSQGLKHIIPPATFQADGKGRHLTLTVRHYLDESDIGFVYVTYSRLVKLGE